MSKTKFVYLTTEQIKQLINMLENASFKGTNASLIVSLLNNLNEGLKNESVDNNSNNTC